VTTLRAIPRLCWNLVEAAQSEESVADDQERPAVADDLERPRDRAFLASRMIKSVQRSPTISSARAIEQSWPS
jgi:hypothetical protein